jgi:hypothetical protein
MFNMFNYVLRMAAAHSVKAQGMVDLPDLLVSQSSILHIVIKILSVVV